MVLLPYLITVIQSISRNLVMKYYILGDPVVIGVILVKTLGARSSTMTQWSVLQLINVTKTALRPLNVMR